MRRAKLNKLVGNYNWYTGQPSEIDVALTYANLDAANAAVQEAQWYAAALRGDPLPAEASGAKLAALQAGEGRREWPPRPSLRQLGLSRRSHGVVGSVDIHRRASTPRPGSRWSS